MFEGRYLTLKIPVENDTFSEHPNHCLFLNNT
eukprot:UN12808